MNERIQELADKIWAEEYWDNPATDKLLPAQLNKFAELIVRECIEHLESSVAVPNIEHSRTKTKCIKSIKQHFGVEE